MIMTCGKLHRSFRVDQSSQHAGAASTICLQGNTSRPQTHSNRKYECM